MVSEKPPRRSEVEREPTTIDQASSEQPLAEPVRAIDSDEAVVSDGAPTEGTPPSGELGIADMSSAGTAEEQPATLANSEKKPVEDVASEPAAWSESPADTAAALPAPVAPRTSTLLATGILGGAVALLLAGSMQYAGYLPALGPQRVGNNSDLSPAIDALQRDVAAMKNRPLAAAQDPALVERVAALEAAGRAGDGYDDPQIEALRQEIATLRSSVENARSQNSQLGQRLQAAEARLTEQGPAQQAARALAAAGLKTAIDRGGPFEPEFQVFSRVAGDDPALARLRDFAKDGVPARHELEREFSRLADTIIDASAAPDPNEGLADRLLVSALSVVKVRRVGETEGETPDAVVARIAEGLRVGDLPRAAREWETLPERAKPVSVDFKKKLDARIEAERLVADTLIRAAEGIER